MYVATISSKYNGKSKFETLLKMGYRNFRVNFARGNINDNYCLINSFINISKSQEINCSLFVDLPGSKMRVGKISNGTISLRKGHIYTLDVYVNIPGGDDRAPLQSKKIFNFVEVGDRLVLGDSQGLLQVVRKSSNALKCKVVRDGIIYGRCGICIENKYIEYSTLTDKDKTILKLIKNLSIYLCPSFSDNSMIVDECKKNVKNGGIKGIIAKIESPIGVNNLELIVQAADGIMLCRGDLSNHYSLTEMRELALKMKKLTQKYSKKFILATDYFKSMISNNELTNIETEELKWALKLKSDYLIMNETSYSDNWMNIAKFALKFKSK